MSRGLLFFFSIFGWLCLCCFIRSDRVRHPCPTGIPSCNLVTRGRGRDWFRVVLLYHYTIVIVKVKGLAVVFLKVFWNRRKSLVSKDLGRLRPAPLALSAYRARGYVNPASNLQPRHHEAQAHARTLRGERKGTRFRCSRQFRTAPHTLAVQG